MKTYNVLLLGLLCALAAGCASVNRDAAKEPVVLHIARACMTGQNTADNDNVYIGITTACARGVRVVARDTAYMLPIKKTAISAYRYSGDAADYSELQVTLTPGTSAEDALCFAEKCVAVTAYTGRDSTSCICDAASSRILSYFEAGLHANTYTNCACTLPESAFDAPPIAEAKPPAAAAKIDSARNVQTKLLKKEQPKRK